MCLINILIFKVLKYDTIQVDIEVERSSSCLEVNQMNDKHQMKFFIFAVMLLFAGIFLAACGKDENQPDYVTILSVEPTDSVDDMYTAAAETIYVNMTQTEQAKPTETPVPPTETPIPTQTYTATTAPTATTAWVYAPVVYPTSTPGTKTATATVTGTIMTATSDGSASSYACSITAQGISDNTEFSPNEEFDATWTIKNTGSSNWDASSIDYRYVSGTATYKHNAVYDFPSTVAVGDSITIVVDMIAPSSAAAYESFWGVFNGGVNFCSLPLRIKVVE